MKNLSTFLSTVFALLGFGAAVNAQCLPVTVDVTTDTWGYECYWELTPQGDACGTNTIATYGNTVEVNCGSGGSQVATAGGYGDNMTTTEDLGCVPTGCYTVHYVDDFGDGGATFDVYVDGVLAINFVGADAGGSFDFCVTGAAIVSDGAMTAITSSEYTMMPLTQAGAMTVEGEMSSLGSGDLTNAMINAEIFMDATSVATESSAGVTIASGTSNSETLTAYTPMANGLYTVELVSSMDETDEDTSNDTLSYQQWVNDSVMARDTDLSEGTLGIGAPLENGMLGQTYTVSADNEMLTSVTAMFGSDAIGSYPTLGDSTRFVIYDMSSGTPGAELARTSAYVFTPADTLGETLHTIALDAPLSVANGSTILVCAAEYNFNVTLATNAGNVTLGTNWVNWDTQPNGGWSLAEGFGFEVQYIIRANFQSSASVSNNDMYNVGVSPNPTTNNVVVEIPAELVGSDFVVVDQMGRTISNGTFNTTSNKVEMTSFETGVYFIKVANTTVRVVKK